MSKELEDFCAKHNFTLKISEDGLRYEAKGDGMIFKRESVTGPKEIIAREFLYDLIRFKQQKQ